MGETQKFTVCYKKYVYLVKHIAVEYLNDYFDAEDVCHDVFIKLYERLDSFEKEEDIKAWLSVVTRNRAIDMNRMFHKNKMIYIGDYDEVEIDKLKYIKEPIEDYMLKKELISKVSTSIENMKEDLKNVLYVHCSLDVPQEKACKTLGIEVGTYRVRLFRARKFLRKKFENELRELW